MKKSKKLGGFKVHPIGIGTWGVGGFMEPVRGNEENEIKAIRYSIKKGQNHIDTAEMYGNGHSEEVVGQAIKGLDRKRLFIASKVHRFYTKDGEVVKSTKKILKRLGINQLDILYIHAYWDEDMMKYLEGVNNAKDKGLTRHIAVSNFTTSQLKWAVSKSRHKIVANQMNYNVLHQVEVPKEMKTLCKKENIAIVAYRPVERGLLSDNCDNEVVLEVAKKYKKTPAQIAINWLISQESVVTIPKSTKKDHIDENLGAMDFELEGADINTLNGLQN